MLDTQTHKIELNSKWKENVEIEVCAKELAKSFIESLKFNMESFRI